MSIYCWLASRLFLILQATADLRQFTDTGDLHDGNGLSDATFPDGRLSNPIFEEIDYDLLTIGNHELYLASVAQLTFAQFSKFYGDKYITSNVQILNNATNQFEYIGKQYRYFTTQQGLRIMAFGVLYDFTGNTNITQVMKAATLVQQPWFQSAISFDKPIDLFIVLGHNPARPGASGSTFGTIFKAIRAKNPNTPIQLFGGHSHIRDFAVLDDGSTSLESGRYCETLGWVSMSGIKSSAFTGNNKPHGVPNPSQKAVKVASATVTASSTVPAPTSNPAFSNLLYSRRYIDWNRLSFAYHAVGSQSNTFDYHSGLRVTGEITKTRKQLNLTTLYGCAPQTYCESCKPFLAPGNIFTVVQTALAATVINPARAATPRFIIINTGSIRFDLVQGPFTFDDSFIVSPFLDGFQYIPNVPFSQANQVLAALNKADTKRSLRPRDFSFTAMTGQDCIDDVYGELEGKPGLARRSAPLTRGKHRRATSSLTPGYTTKGLYPCSIINMRLRIAG